MEFILTILGLLVLIGLSNIMNHFIPFIPVPFIQIGLGIFAVLFFGTHIEIGPDVFFFLFVAPLLFYSGKNISRTALWELKTPVLLLALGLVFVTVLVSGYFIHRMIPTIPLTAAFALTAILAPIDVTIIRAMADRIKLPMRMVYLLEGEGLMNVALSLVVFQFAVAATVTGVFSLTQAAGSFFLISIGGFLCGAILAYVIIKLELWIRDFGMEDITIHMLFQFLTPFILYYSVEFFHLSGILAVIAGGLVYSIEHDQEDSPNSPLKVVSTSTWKVLLYLLNGLVFVLLGLQIPNLATTIFANPYFEHGQVIGYIIIITLFLLLLRYLWIWLIWKIRLWIRKGNSIQLHTKSLLILSISGVRGTVTMAGAFSIPYMLVNGDPFPERSLIIFIGAGVILLTLLLSSIFLPILSRTDEMERKNRLEEMAKQARVQTKKAAIQVVDSQISDDNRDAALTVISLYNARINQILFEGQAKEKEGEQHQLEMEIRKKTLEYQDRYLEELMKQNEVDRELVYICLEYVQRLEIRLTNQLKFRWFWLLTWCKHLILKIRRLFLPNRAVLKRKKHRRIEKIREVKIQMFQAAIRNIKNNMTPKNKNMSILVISDYKRLISMLNQEKLGGKFRQTVHIERILLYKAMQAEREELQAMFERGDISREITNKIRREINQRELMEQIE